MRSQRGGRGLEGSQDGGRHPCASSLRHHIHSFDLYGVRSDDRIVEGAQPSAGDGAAGGICGDQKHGNVVGGGRDSWFVVAASVSRVEFSALFTSQPIGVGVVVVDGGDLPVHRGPFGDNRYGNRCYGVVMPRVRDDEATRQRLSEAVFLTLADRGPTGLTLRAVAERAGCSTGLVLHTFRDKRELLLHARDVLHERTRVRSDALESDAADAATALRDVVFHALPSDSEKLAEARVWIGFLAAALSDPILAERHALHSRAFATRLVRLLEASGASDAVGARERASTLAAAVEGVSTLAAGDPERWPASRQRQALELVLEATTAVARPIA